MPASWLPSTHRLRAFFWEREFYVRLFQLALPITLQQIIFSSLNLVSGVIIGQLGDTAVAAIGLCNQLFFLLALFIFGTSSGAAIFTAQYWGKRDIPNLRRVLGIALSLGVAGGGLFSVAAVFFPELVLGIYSSDAAVVALGSSYLRVAGGCGMLMAVTSTYNTALRSIGQVRVPLVVSLGALTLNAILSYALVLGIGGLPALGMQGAAWALLVSRTLECAALLTIVYWNKLPVAATLREMLAVDWPFFRHVLARVAPVIANEIIWALGVAAYNVIYARLGTDALAAMNIASVVDGLAFVMAIGIGNACAIMVGNEIGAGHASKAFRYAGRALGLTILSGLLMGGVVCVLAPAILVFYKVSDTTLTYTRLVFLVLAAGMWLRSVNFLLIVGTLRSGGDTRFALVLDAGSIWVVGVSLAALGAFVLHWPIYLVYLLTLGDELVKALIAGYRFLSRKWIHNLAHGTDQIAGIIETIPGEMV